MFLISTVIAKTLSKIFNLLNIGSGYTWPGHVVLKLFPDIWTEVQKRLPEKVVFITGTNGKTTTSKLTTHIFEKSGYKIINNKTGANLLNGILSTILIETDAIGNAPADFAVFEVDEFTLLALSEKIKPHILVLLNISRDQLDRHWELEIILEKWQKVLEKMDDNSVLVVDSTQPQLTALAQNFRGKVLTFDASKSLDLRTTLSGAFNTKNINAAFLITNILGITPEKAKEALQSFEFAYGRGEKTLFKNKNFRIFLAKNPESLNQNLMLLNERSLNYDSLLFILNDKVPDGHDVSWIYDVNPAFLKTACENKTVFTSGIRAYDMAVRLRYAGVSISEDNISQNISEAVKNVINNAGKDIIVLPNYSAMLEFRKSVFGRKIL